MGEAEKILNQCRGENLPPCQFACPAHIDTRQYIGHIAAGRFKEALAAIREQMPFAGVCGRVCMHPCEAACQRGQVDEAVAIRALKRFAADYELTSGREAATAVEPTKEGRVAVVGSGPAGLACAYDLVRRGYPVTVFEAAPQSGGLLRYGIPEYRLPKKILDNDIAYIRDLGVEIKTDSPVTDLKELTQQGFKAVFLGTGALASRGLDIPDEQAQGVVQALDFLKSSLDPADDGAGDRVAVIGGGNAAIDSARSAWRLGGKKVQLIYRRTKIEMPAESEEVEAAAEEGIEIRFLTTPVRVIAQNGQVCGLECIRMELGEPDESGRRRPKPVDGSEFTVEADKVIVAIGQEVDQAALPDKVACTERGTVAADPITMATNIPGVFAGGDLVDGPSSVIRAVAAGKAAAESIDRFLSGLDLSVDRPESPDCLKDIDTSGAVKTARAVMPHLDLSKRRGFGEVELGLSEEAAVAEAKRCLACECRVCIKNCQFLDQFCDSPRELAWHYQDDRFQAKPQVPFSCNLCGLCETICPEGLNIGNMCRDARLELVDQGVAPLRPHKLLQLEQNRTLSEEFCLALPDPAKGSCRAVFFPGCHLSAYSPDLVAAAFDWLNQRRPEVGFLLRCCGAPTINIGDKTRFNEIRSGFEAQLEAMGADEIIAACPNCLGTIRENVPGIKATSLYEVMAEAWPAGEPANGRGVFTIHDPCTGRHDTRMQAGIRKLCALNGIKVEEMAHSGPNTHCCGMGGMIAYTSPGLANKITRQRVAEAPCNILTYCATCRDTLGSMKPTLHMLDILFDPEWDCNGERKPHPMDVKKENQRLLKQMLVEKYQDRPVA